ncbi:hypothetical protein A1O1_05279 [Capronia coronata CBS 617.96]|uniref:Uncharacterized protein n=1 Tax=Capronia coronata CBS 617.96 TaxID=1182541 RepID=W9Z1H9_9EURO|nr:uncharacterized protein A1O1_05279 [Capronia coronata CBS 617.96]EXJ88349.1 hypothetical protein A1O1_05279 [Capronia coronata CBS 617.96]
MSDPRFSLPASSTRHAQPPPGHPSRPDQNLTNRLPPSFRRIKPLVYAIGVAGIVGSGALIGAVLKISHQEEAQKAQAQQQDHPGEKSLQQSTMAEYAKSIQALETKRGHLIGQKIQLEGKIRELRESQRRRAEEEAEKKEFEMNK